MIFHRCFLLKMNLRFRNIFLQFENKLREIWFNFSCNYTYRSWPGGGRWGGEGGGCCKSHRKAYSNDVVLGHPRGRLQKDSQIMSVLPGIC